MKKFLTAFFILFLSFYSLSSSEAATSMRFLKNHTTSDSYLVKEATVVHRTANGLHNERCYKLTCTLSHTHTWHCYIEDCKPSNHICPACGQTHGDSFETFEPKCGCSNISPASQSEINKFIGSSKYTAVDDTITREYTCNNEALLGAGSRVTAVKCTLTYTTYTLIPEQKPLCTHTDDKCSIHSQPFGGNHNDYVPSGTKHVCTNCNKTYYTGVSCSKPDAVACHIDSVCSIHGSTYNGYHGDYTPSYVSYKTCSTCKKTYYTGVSCSLANSPSDPITPEPEQCNLISYGSCSCPLSDIGSPAVTRADTPFSTSFTPSNTYFLIGDSFKINGSHHILRTFDQRVSPMPVSCPGYTPYYICQTHGAACVNSYSGPTAYCGWSGTIIDYGSATYFDKFHDISVVFKGFTVTNNKTSDVITAPADIGPLSTPPSPDSTAPYSRNYQITGIDLSALSYDSNKGTSYGTVTVKCECGESREFRIYFDFRGKGNPNIYKLIVSAGKGGTASGSKNPATPGNIYRISAKADQGYTFAGWYDLNNTRLYSNAEQAITMPSSNLYLIARFKANGSGRIDFGKNDTSLGISSVRDLRWKNYFVQNSQLTGNFFSVPSNNKVMLDSSAPSGYNNYTNIKMGYAVEFEFDSLNVTKDTSELEIQATFYNDNNNIISRTSLKDAITGKELDPSYTNFSNKTQPSKFTRVMDFNTLNNGVTSPGVTWNFIYYLPARLSNLNNTALNTNNIKVKLDIFLKDNSGKTLLNYITFINNNDCPWNGQVFRYSTKESLLDDIKDSNTY